MGLKTLEFLAPVVGLLRVARERDQARQDVETAAARTQSDLELQRTVELKQEADVREKSKRRAETRGQRFGFGRTSFLGALGFGSGRSQAGAGRGRLFGN